MQIVLVSDAYPPMKTSGAVQIRDLVNELCRQGHEVTVLLPDATLHVPWSMEEKGGLTILRLRAMKTKDVSYLRRAVAEHLLSYFMLRSFMKSPLKGKHWQAIIWYSPSIFFGGLVARLKAVSRCPAYLILRDIFPEWAVDMGLLRRGLVYGYFKRKERFQYEQADVIGVQTPSNRAYFRAQYSDIGARIEVLNNWLAPATDSASCSIDLERTVLSGKAVFVYIGNIGVAQGIDILIYLAATYKEDSSVGFLFVGRGTAVGRLKSLVTNLSLDNVVFHDEIAPEEIPGLLAQCRVGLIALDPRHSNDNIPGKFLAYMQAGLPVLAAVNPGNDLEKLISDHRVGEVVTDNNLDSLKRSAQRVLSMGRTDTGLAERCRQLSVKYFSPAAAVKQITESLRDAAS